MKNKDRGSISGGVGTGQLFLNNQGYLQVEDHVLQIGEPISVLVLNGLTGVFEWIDTTVEFDDDGVGYFLPGLYGYRIIGLFAEYYFQLKRIV